MGIFVSNVLLAWVWMFLWEDVSTAQFFIGFIIAYLILFLFRGLLPDSSYFRRSIGLIKFVAMFLYKNIEANLIVTKEVLTPQHTMTPGFVKVNPESETPLEITWLAATISLIPGTLTVDTSEDDDFLYVHAMHISDPQDIKDEIVNELEPVILEFLR